MDKTNKYILSNVNVISMQSDQVQNNMDILINNGMICDIVPHNHLKLSIEKIDFDGKYVMPGLIDSHVHLQNLDCLNWFLGYGVLSVVNLKGCVTHLNWREGIRQKKMVGPDIITAGPIIDSTKRYLAYMDISEEKCTVEEKYDQMLSTKSVIEATDVEKARKAVRYIKEVGYDIVKIYDNISREVYEAIWDEAQKISMKVVGHLPGCVDSAPILQNTIEHVSSIDEKMLGWIIKAGTRITPTLTVEKLYFGNASEDITYKNAMNRINPIIKEQWLTAQKKHLDTYTVNRNPNKKPVNRRGDDYYNKLLDEFLHLGGKILAGTDSGIENNIPGYFLHKELEYLSETGASAYEVLKMATINPAEFYWNDPKRGMLCKNNEAKLLILNRNPMLDIRNTKDIIAVINGTDFYSKKELVDMLDAGKTKQKEEIKFV